MSYTIIPPEAELDRAAILDLWHRNLPEASVDRYDWLYETGMATGWLLRAESGEVVGSTGLMDREMRVFGGDRRAGQAIDLNVDKDHRSMGPALRLQRAVTDVVRRKQADLIYALPIAQSEPVLRRVGYKVVGPLHRWVKPLGCEELLAHWLRHSLPCRVAATLFNPLLQLASAETYRRRPAGRSIEVVDRFDDRFDDLWQSVAGQYPIIGERTAAYLTWRFRRCAEVRHRAMCFSDDNGRLLAYVVFFRRARTVWIVDFLFAKLASFDMLLGEFLRRMRRERAAKVVAAFLGPDSVSRTFRRLGFWQRPSGRNALVYADPERFGPEAPRLLDRENWYLTLADADTDS